MESLDEIAKLIGGGALQISGDDTLIDTSTEADDPAGTASEGAGDEPGG